MDIQFPWQFNNQGRTAATNDSIRNMIEQLLFTNPGERVNRPDFGSSLMQLIFDANSPEQTTALTLSLQVTLQHWLGDVIAVQSLDVANDDSNLTVSIQYVVRSTNASQQAQFTRNV